ncbi:hypothetical protein [Schlesneria sp. T3-172]|uniref:hypothetical protein n=1 Tax=Schlesneria TaxID=656899 RepID=UPI002F1BA270
MVTYFQDQSSSRFAGWAKWMMFAVLISLAPTGRGIAQESFHPSVATTQPSINIPWWHSLYYKSNGMSRYGYGFGNMTRNVQWRLPINPPISSPSYGYFQPCWRQVPTVRRCVTCETFPSNREVPHLDNPTYSNSLPPTPTIPPAPGASETDRLPSPLLEAPDEPESADPTEAPKASDDDDFR